MMVLKGLDVVFDCAAQVGLMRTCSLCQAHPNRNARPGTILSRQKTQGLKPRSLLGFTARLKSGPDTKQHSGDYQELPHSADFESIDLSRSHQPLVVDLHHLI